MDAQGARRKLKAFDKWYERNNFYFCAVANALAILILIGMDNWYAVCSMCVAEMWCLRYGWLKKDFEDYKDDIEETLQSAKAAIRRVKDICGNP